ncbi:Mammalian cell entry related domain protein [Candidatus Methylobacter favarea]|uniref:Mammalian cell entry related domain protein n=1 Tax=Candidatus Methylobacter favarea TaxID=2707345 RepID=A0A8S0W9D8_9GAMM|nr:MlaD family protein [Candidatus Methylobacter favarea]CAA9889896.1 Mammalian cell entry related domain protein [Candidatus Methylobacter favarea]
MGRDKHALITGLFLIILVTAVTAIIYWIGHFERERNVYVISTRESVSGLNPESTVFYRGIAVGKVINILFDPNDSSTILVPIEVDKQIVLTKGVYATLNLKGVTGLTQIELEDEGGISIPLPPGDEPANRIPLKPSLTDRLMSSGEDILKKADHIMMRLGLLLSDENTESIGGILTNLKTLTDKLSDLQKAVDRALAGVPALSKDAHKTLTNIDDLTNDLKSLTREVKALGIKANKLADTSRTASDILLETTLPKVNELLAELQSTTTQVSRVATMLENDPRSLLLGPGQQEPGPGEPGYQESQ